MVASRLLLAIPVLLALAIASVSPSPKVSAMPEPTAPTAAPQARPAAPPTPPGARPPGERADDECTCAQHLLWEECEPAWHHDQQAEEATPRGPKKRPAPGSQDGPI